MSKRAMTQDESMAVAAYAAAARDLSDFLDLTLEMTPEAKRVLVEMCVTPNPKHDAETKELNAWIAGYLRP